ncbi:hypothetical protein ACMZ6Y_06010 [Streptococcus pluranimalium]|nr:MULTISPECIES: hypothetical protein [Streptococcus]NJW38084.1 hypothetical protein [Streptococcus suis]MCD3384865.1 hypothetical protein [Streptococcus equi subsp. zooepidemicus]MCD3393243.1 hypothetical protein [Streptococcus equi subsp. zooepidemicus]MCD3428954.1 hypothetical protein [Streptococcus equi subsp. zooepidemicus]MDI6035359.1 hypothetical protein [Streptococcus equi subsp. zooepidemicus]
MAQVEIITVLGISNKEDKKEGWLSCVKTNSPAWKTLLLPFNKEIFSSVFNQQLGIYEVKLNNTAVAFGSKPKFEIAEARLIVSFDEILKAYK